MEYRKAYLIPIIGVVAASGCIDQSSETELMSINYEPPSEFETSLSYLGLGIEEFRPENTSSSQIYDDGNRNYIYAGRVRFNPNNFYTNESVEGLKGFFQNQTPIERE